MHPSSVNHITREGKELTDDASYAHDIYAFAEKRQNLTTGSEKPQMSLMSTTKLEPLTYLLFGAFEVRPAGSVLECDEWVPVSGYLPVLQEVGKLKYLMEHCLLRVYEGIAEGRRKSQQRSTFITVGEQREEEWEDEEAGAKRGPLSRAELDELAVLGREIVDILDRYSHERGSRPSSRRGSRPGTPSGGGSNPHSSSGGPPTSSYGRDNLRVPGQGLRSGYTTPRTQYSRPSTPSRLSRPPSRTVY